jgi:hypothetical protein
MNWTDRSHLIEMRRSYLLLVYSLFTCGPVDVCSIQALLDIASPPPLARTLLLTYLAGRHLRFQTRKARIKNGDFLPRRTHDRPSTAFITCLSFDSQSSARSIDRHATKRSGRTRTQPSSSTSRLRSLSDSVSHSALLFFVLLTNRDKRPPIPDPSQCCEH